MIFSTETGSTYEIDLGGSRVRRLSNVLGTPPTACFGADGEWRSYIAATLWHYSDVDSGIAFWWDDDAPHDFTKTSAVLRDETGEKLLESLDVTAWRKVS